MIKNKYKMICKDFISKSKVYNYYNDLVKVKDLKIKSIIIDEESYRDQIIYFLGMFLKYQYGESRLYYCELFEKIEGYDGRKYFVVNDSVLN